ncbi:hypothetical protein BKA70DRAFT_1572162 [Coprinopsis sp. MPI-PUGE-AT-0042]|nr:hypothetical protein BKA70DRAFT_1572162 [Coprinopsis sp. MPI-PUGE-AT-0042]
MLMKATGAILSKLLLLFSVFTTIVVAIPAFARAGSAVLQYLSAQNVPSLDELWEVGLRQSAKAQAYANNVLKETRSTYRDVASKVDEFKSSMDGLIADSKQFRAQLETSNISFGDLSKKLSHALDGVSQAILGEFKEPLPENQDERYMHREVMITFALNKIEAAFGEVCAALGMEKEKAHAMFERIRPKLHHIISVTGSIIDRHPVLLENIIYTGVFLLIPEAWLLRPLFGVFGFGPRDPVKGSTAAWRQRRFWGEVVKRGSWSVFMKGVGWGWKVIDGIFDGFGPAAGTQGR